MAAHLGALARSVMGSTQSKAMGQEALRAEVITSAWHSARQPRSMQRSGARFVLLACRTRHESRRSGARRSPGQGSEQIRSWDPRIRLRRSKGRPARGISGRRRSFMRRLQGRRERGYQRVGERAGRGREEEE
ncbi:hypothetical protein D1007_29812 [Hordeum vulgare]|nr:hypothetical protein D1007_29812 [Hordeum vulgare]